MSLEGFEAGLTKFLAEFDLTTEQFKLDTITELTTDAYRDLLDDLQKIAKNPRNPKDYPGIIFVTRYIESLVRVLEATYQEKLGEILGNAEEIKE